MPIKTFIEDGQGKGHQAHVDHTQALKVRVGEPSTATRTILAANNTAYNIIEPKSSSRFLITGVILNAASSVTGQALVDLYEATTSTETTIQKAILTIDILKNATTPLLGLNILTTKGVFINAKTDDNVINITVIGHFEYIDESE